MKEGKNENISKSLSVKFCTIERAVKNSRTGCRFVSQSVKNRNTNDNFIVRCSLCAVDRVSHCDCPGCSSHHQNVFKQFITVLYCNVMYSIHIFDLASVDPKVLLLDKQQTLSTVPTKTQSRGLQERKHDVQLQRQPKLLHPAGSNDVSCSSTSRRQLFLVPWRVDRRRTRTDSSA